VGFGVLREIRVLEFESKTPMLPFLRTVADDTVFWAGCVHQLGMRRQEVVPGVLFQGWRLRTPAGATLTDAPLILCKSADITLIRPRLILFTEMWKMRPPTTPLFVCGVSFCWKILFEIFRKNKSIGSGCERKRYARVCMGKCVSAPWANV